MTAAHTLVACSILAAAALGGTYAVRARAWAVMTDELQVARLATSIAETLSPFPAIHGVYYGALSQLYPLLLAPFYGTMTAPNAEIAAHALNAVLIAGAALPAYLLGRSVGGSRAAGVVAAALTAFTPWLVLASTLLTENAAYPAFVWAVFLCQRAIARPSAGRDVAAPAGLLLAFFARTQLFVLALALPFVVLLHEAAYGAALRGVRSARAAALAACRRAFRRHRALAAAYALGALGCALLAVRGSLGSLVGNYATPFRGELVPPGLWGSAAAHFDHVVVGAGVLPFALAASWSVTAVARPERKEAHAFAVLLLVLIPLLTFEVASFDLRFTPHQFVQDRYLLYLAPLFAVGAGAWLAQRTQRTFRLVSLLGAGALLVLLLGWAAYDQPIIFWAAPAAAFHPAVATASGWVGLPAGWFLRIVAAAAVLAVAAAAWRLPRAALVGTAAALTCLGAFQAAYVLHRFSDPVMTRSTASPARDWVDRAVPADESVALVPNATDSPTWWWEAELWNKDVDRALRVGRSRTFTPFPAARVTVDYTRGTLRGAQPSDYLVLSPNETRFRLHGTTHIADGRPLRLVRTERPYRLAWATRGVAADGWTHPGHAATLRLFGQGRGGRRTVVLTLAASRFAPRPLEFAFTSGRAVVRGGVDPGGARPPVRLSLCVPAAGHVDTTITTRGESRLPDGRLVALHLDGLEVRDAAGPC
jgi:hypothetical protein